ncbi:MAG TPA: hypothetical protein VE818_07095, partial [Nitrososphaeraceae archaeon]|nr:hypothetical protein [Nitrososphaeraceae archaeon]
VLDSTGLSDAAAVVVSLAGLFSIVTSSCITGTSTVFISVTGSFVIVASCADSCLDTFSLSSIRGTRVSVSRETLIYLLLLYTMKKNIHQQL